MGITAKFPSPVSLLGNLLRAYYVPGLKPGEDWGIKMGKKGDMIPLPGLRPREASGVRSTLLCRAKETKTVFSNNQNETKNS